MVNTEQIIRHAVQENVKITLVINKIDRLILELRIKPADAYYKIKHTIEEVNTAIRYSRTSTYFWWWYILTFFIHSAVNPDPELRVSPERGNVAFASTEMAWCFTLRSFAQMYADTYGNGKQLMRHCATSWHIYTRFCGCWSVRWSFMGRHLL